MRGEGGVGGQRSGHCLALGAQACADRFDGINLLPAEVARFARVAG